MKTTLTALAVLALLAAAALAAAWGGWVAVGATDPHAAPVEWFLATARERAVARHAARLAVPPLDDPRLLRAGVVRYHRLCAGCHGAPGLRPAPLAAGLAPPPPDLTVAAAGEDATARTFWVVKHGLRMTGMPAFGPTHGDDQLWAVTAVVERLPELSPSEYAAMVESAGAALPADGVAPSP